MKTLFLLLFTCFSISLFSQNATDLNAIQPEGDYENISVKKLDSDTNSTSFAIVKSHKHETHSEIIYVVEGEGLMTVNRKEFKIKPGDYFRIPKNTFHSLIVTSELPMKVLSVQSPEFLGKDRVFEN